MLNNDATAAIFQEYILIRLRWFFSALQIYTLLEIKSSYQILSSTICTYSSYCPTEDELTEVHNCTCDEEGDDRRGDPTDGDLGQFPELAHPLLACSRWPVGGGGGGGGADL
jgi:hypothetical protein